MSEHKDQAKKLMTDRSAIEAEIKTLEEKLAEFSKFNYDQPLVDQEGFPRPDLDFESLREYKQTKQKLNRELKRTGQRF